MGLPLIGKSGLSIFPTGALNNGPLNGGYEATSVHINADGTVATSTTKNGSAYLSRDGWLKNPDGSIVISTTKQGGAQITKCGVLTNPDGSAVVSTVPTNAFLNSKGILINPDGTMIVNNGST